MGRNRSNMTVGRLKEMLEDIIRNAEDEDEVLEMEIGFSYDYGDHCHGRVVQGVSDVEARSVKRSDYYRMDKLVDEDEEDGVPAEGTRKMIVIT